MNEVNKLKRALRRAAEEIWQSSVVDTGMREIEISYSKDYETERDWIQYKLDDWMKP